MKNVIVIGLALLIVGGFAGMRYWKHHAERQVALDATRMERDGHAPPKEAPPALLPQRLESSAPFEAATIQVNKSEKNAETTEASEPAPSSKKPVKASSTKPAAGPGNKPVRDEWARFALSFVGADPEAEQYWVLAINDPNLSAHERQDLIEDLNEDGLSDPKNPSPEDLPLIVNRLAIIEELAGSPMDQVNADAFKEAYKDLLNLAALAMGEGDRVK
jgi:hypothetical protein